MVCAECVVIGALVYGIARGRAGCRLNVDSMGGGLCEASDATVDVARQSFETTRADGPQSQQGTTEDEPETTDSSATRHRGKRRMLAI